MKILGLVTSTSIGFYFNGYLTQAFYVDGYKSVVFAFSNKYGIYWYE